MLKKFDTNHIIWLWEAKVFRDLAEIIEVSFCNLVQGHRQESGAIVGDVEWTLGKPSNDTENLFQTSEI